MEIASVGKGVKKLKPSCIARGNTKWCGYCFTLRHIHKRTENRYSDKNLYRNIHVSIIHNSQKVEITQMPIN